MRFHYGTVMLLSEPHAMCGYMSPFNILPKPVPNQTTCLCTSSNPRQQRYPSIHNSNTNLLTTLKTDHFLEQIPNLISTTDLYSHLYKIPPFKNHGSWFRSIKHLFLIRSRSLLPVNYVPVQIISTNRPTANLYHSVLS